MTEQFDEQYREAEQKLEKEMIFAYERSQQVQQNIRRDLSLTDEERVERYEREFGPIAEQLYTNAATFIGRWDSERAQLTRTVHEAVGERFADHLARVSDLPNESLDQLMETAQRTGQADLEQAVAEVSLTRQGFSRLFNQFTERYPERAQALKRLHSLPPTEQLVSRAGARGQVPAVSPEALRPKKEDREFVERVKSQEAAQEREERTRPRLIRQVGRRVSVY